MQRSDFHFDLPPELIAQVPLGERRASRLLVLDGGGGAIADRTFADLPQLLNPNDLLVLNDTRVLPARVLGRKPTGGRVEIMLERVLAPRRALVHLRANHKPQQGSEVELPGQARARVGARAGELVEIELDRDLVPYLDAHGQTPLPPYIARSPVAADRERYQTVFARAPGAVAAPTAGLHFEAGMLDARAPRGIERTFLTLHVGAGTFAPVRTERIEDHELHAEWLEVPATACAAVERCRAMGGRVVAVGTTSVRALETAARGGKLAPFDGDSRLFIHPGFEFHVVDAMVTNFHLPESSLLMLVSAFAGRELVRRAYELAVAERYRFFSFGDAMLIL
jgi:S-adenosylmethionine:tRNA ribosyltransferase-isomerase